jgi:tRNA threonylcarbamoyladenosine biosynthesis protein TsaB
MLADLAAIVVVNGPGSFTGMRTGLATAKGLCEASSLPLVTVSRLAVLAAGAAGLNTMAALDAGRGELYLREGAHEFLGCADDLESILQGRAVVVAEGRLYERLVVELGTDRVMLRPLHAADALQVVLLHPAQPSSVLAEANYVRLERDIYPRAAGR